MPTVRYTVIDGEVIAEKRNGVRRLYVPDPLGSTVALLGNTQAKTDTFTYWPYGEEASRTGTTPTPFRHVGAWGYYRDAANRTYVRAREYRPDLGSWLMADPIGLEGGDLDLFRYAAGRPTAVADPSGLQGPTPWPDPRGKMPSYCEPPQPPGPCGDCAKAIYRAWWDTPQHVCNHPYIHCMLCCVLTLVDDEHCAITWQSAQNIIDPRSAPGRARMRYCTSGIRAAHGLRSPQECDQACRKLWHWRDRPVDSRCKPAHNRNRAPLPVPRRCPTKSKRLT